MGEKIDLKKKVLSENERLAAEIRSALKAHVVAALNFVSSPGSGKTTLLEQSLSRLNNEIQMGLCKTGSDKISLIKISNITPKSS